MFRFRGFWNQDLPHSRERPRISVTPDYVLSVWVFLRNQSGRQRFPGIEDIFHLDIWQNFRAKMRHIHIAMTMVKHIIYINLVGLLLLMDLHPQLVASSYYWKFLIPLTTNQRNISVYWSEKSQIDSTTDSRIFKEIQMPWKWRISLGIREITIQTNRISWNQRNPEFLLSRRKIHLSKPLHQYLDSHTALFLSLVYTIIQYKTLLGYHTPQLQRNLSNQIGSHIWS